MDFIYDRNYLELKIVAKNLVRFVANLNKQSKSEISAGGTPNSACLADDEDKFDSF